MTDDTPTTTSGDKTITVLGALVTIAGFVLAWIVWTSAGEITGHTVAMIIPIIEFRFSVAFLLPVLSEGFVLMSVRIANARETDPKTRSFARKAIGWTIAIMALVGLIVNTPMAELPFAQWVVAAIIGCGTPVALWLGWTLRSRYAEDCERYEERRAARRSSATTKTATATPTATSKPRSATAPATDQPRSATPTATDHSRSATAPATDPTRSATAPATDQSRSATPAEPVKPETPTETTAPIDSIDRATDSDDAPSAEIEDGIQEIEQYLREVLEADGKRAAAADYVRYLVLVHGRELGEITGSEIAAGVGVSSALGRRVRQEFDNGKLTVTNEDKRRFESFGLLIQSDSTSKAD